MYGTRRRGGIDMAKSVKRKKTVGKVLLYADLIVGLWFTCFPILWMLFSSFKSNWEMFRLPPKLFPESFDLSAYRSIFSNPDKLRFFLNSYIVSFVVTILTLIVAIMAGYSFSRWNFKLKKSLNMFIISTQAVPPITLLIPYFGLVVTLRLYDTYFALILTYLVFTLPYAVLMMTGYFNTLPRALDEAVQIDGGSTSCVLWKILVPVSLPGIVATGIYTFLLCWNEYLFALTLTKSAEMRTVPVGIQLLMGQHSYEWNEMMAMSVLGSFPIILLFLFAQKYFLAGMTAGSVKS